MPPANPQPQIPVSGWIEAGIFVFAIAVLSVAYVIGHGLGAHPIAFILYAMAVSAVVLLIATGPGPDARRIILAPQSWLIGFSTIAMEIFYYLLLERLSPAEGSLLVRLAIPLSLIIGWTLYGRAPRLVAWAGAVVILAGILPLLGKLPPSHRTGVIIATLGSALAFNLRGFAAEFHPWNRNARTIPEKLRITGLIVLVTSIASLALAGGCMLLVAQGLLPPIRIVPTAADMLHMPTILLGVLVGGVILTVIAYLNLSCVVKITTENFSATNAFTPVAALLVQGAAGALGLIPLYAPDASLLPAMAIVIAGMFMILYAARRP
ncbi:MAG: DMT family transporter [Hyphomonadaceae bacterium]|jgi:drug/metabolite transporter (DMT)-like permease|nr:DMT family transporter [Hyphomonadaceae bacterium]